VSRIAAALPVFAFGSGLDDPVIGGLTLGLLMIIVGFVLLISAILWISKVSAVREFGKFGTVISLAVLLVLVIVLAASPAEVAPPSDDTATFEVLSVGGTNTGAIAGCNYTAATHVFTVAMRVNTTGNTIGSPLYWQANWTIQRTDAGETTDVKTVSASYSQTQITDPVTGLTYNSVKPANDGRPSCNWSLPSSVTATYVLSSQMGLTPYSVGAFAINITWNPSAFSTSNVAVNDVVPAGTMVIGPETYSIQVLIVGVDV
jgi:hypothetical protein